MTIASPARAAARPGYHDHIVDVLIAERAPKLSASPLWPLVRPALYQLLDYGKARRMADEIAPLPGRQSMELLSALLAVQLEIQGVERLPPRGRLVAICNH